MGTTIRATGQFADATPTLTVSTGRGNTGRPEVHLTMRDDSDPENAVAVFFWVDRDELLEAIEREEAAIQHTLNIGEPA